MMEQSQEVLIALFETRSEADAARECVEQAVDGDPPVEVLAPGDEARLDAAGDVDTSGAAREVGAGAAIGALGGAGGAAIAGLTVLATGPVAAAVIGAGIGAGAGAVGAAAGSPSLHRPVMVSTLQDALANGRHALVVGVDGEADALALQDTLERTAALKVIDRHGGQHAVRDNVN